MEAVNGVSDAGKGGPPPPSPLTGCYLLIVVGEPHCNEHKDIILQKVAKGLLSWDAKDCLVDLEKELAIITEQGLEGEEARYGERLIQFASENLVTEILIHPVVSTLAQCVRNLLSSFTRHRHIIHAGYTFANNGSWMLQDGTFSLADFSEAFQEIEVLRVIHAYENGISIDIHCAPGGDWTRLPKESFAKGCKVRVNPNDVLTAGSPSINCFISYLEPFLISAELDNILESSDVVGNIRFSRPTLYVFPGGQGDAALFGINGFNMLLDGGFSRKACFWDFVRHLDRLDAVLLTRLNNSNVNGITAVLRRKRQNAPYPQIGHFFCNIQERKAILSPDGDKDKDPLLINLLDEGQEIVFNLRQLSLTPQVCYRDSEPINLYHKVGHGTLDMYVLSPAKDSKEVREFLQKWNSNDQKLFANQKTNREFIFPLQNAVSICALLVWQPANPEDTITRILFPGSSSQNKIFEGLEKIKSLEFIKHPVCSEKSLTPATILKSKQTMLERIIQTEKKISADNKKEKPQKQSVDNAENEMKNGEVDGVQPEKVAPVKKSDSTESEKSISKPKKSIENGDKVEKLKIKLKSEPKSKLRSDSQPRKIKSADQKPSPPTPKKQVEKVNEGLKPKSKASPGATPAKSAKEATNRKVVESKIKAAPKKELSKPGVEKKEVKAERKPISRRPKDISKLSGSPSKKVNGIQKPDSISKRGKLDKEGTTDSSTVSTPSADQDSILKKDIPKLTSDELQNLKAQELADLKEEQEAIKEIEAVFRKGELKGVKSSEFRKIKDGSIDDKLESEEYLIIEKTEIEQNLVNGSNKEDETQKIARDSQESEKQRPKDSNEAEIEDKRVEVQEEVQKIIISATDIVKSKEEGVEASKEVSANSPEDKIDISTDKKDNENELKEVAVESQPDERGSANIESGATTTAPTLPEDERMPLDEIKEDNGDQVIEEKHVKEETKEKDVPVIQLLPKAIETITKLPPVVGIKLDKQSHIRDIVKTPDEVADLPVHEEVDIDHYDEYTSSTEIKPEAEDNKKEDKEKHDVKETSPDENEGTKVTPNEKEFKSDTNKENAEPMIEEVHKIDEIVETRDEVKTDVDFKKETIKELTKEESSLDEKKVWEVLKEPEPKTIVEGNNAVISEDLNKKELSKSPDEEKDTDERELQTKNIEATDLKTIIAEATLSPKHATEGKIEELKISNEKKVEIQPKVESTVQGDKAATVALKHIDISKEEDQVKVETDIEVDKENLTEGLPTASKEKEDIVEKSETEIKEKLDRKPDSTHPLTDEAQKDKLPEEIKEKIYVDESIDKQIKQGREDVDIMQKIEEKLQNLKEEMKLVNEKDVIMQTEKVPLELGVKTVSEVKTHKTEELQHAEPVIIAAESNPESPVIDEKTFDEKLDLGQKSPKEREEDVAKIVVSVAEVLKSDAPLEEFEGKLPFNIPYKSYTTELRETHITTVDSPTSDETKAMKSIETTCPKTSCTYFIEEERKMAPLHEEREVPENKISQMMKDANELMQDTSKIIQDIKQTQQNKPEEENAKEDQDADAGIVHRMLVTASSEDGGEETEICPPGTIIFSRSSESSGRSSPDQPSPKVSQKSSISDSTVITKSVVKDLQTSKIMADKPSETSPTSINDVKEETKNIYVTNQIISDAEKTDTASAESSLEVAEQAISKISEKPIISEKGTTDLHTTSNVDINKKALPGDISENIQTKVSSEIKAIETEYVKEDLEEQEKVDEVDKATITSDVKIADNDKEQITDAVEKKAIIDTTEVTTKLDLIDATSTKTTIDISKDAEPEVASKLKEFEKSDGAEYKELDKRAEDDLKPNLQQFTANKEAGKLNDIGVSTQEKLDGVKVDGNNLKELPENVLGNENGAISTAVIEQFDRDQVVTSESKIDEVDKNKHIMESVSGSVGVTEWSRDVKDSDKIVEIEIKGVKETPLDLTSEQNIMKDSADEKFEIRESIAEAQFKDPEPTILTSTEHPEIKYVVESKGSEEVLKETTLEKNLEIEIKAVKETPLEQTSEQKITEDPADEKAEIRESRVKGDFQDFEPTILTSTEQPETKVVDETKGSEEVFKNSTKSVSGSAAEVAECPRDVEKKLEVEVKEVKEIPLEPISQQEIKQDAADEKIEFGESTAKNEMKASELTICTSSEKPEIKSVDETKVSGEILKKTNIDDSKQMRKNEDAEQVISDQEDKTDGRTGEIKMLKGDDPKSTLGKELKPATGEPVEQGKQEVDNKDQQQETVVKTADKQDEISEGRYDLYNGLETVEKMVVDVLTADREQTILGPDTEEEKEGQTQISRIVEEVESDIEKLIEKGVEEVKEFIEEGKESVASIFKRESSKEEILEKTAHDVEENYKIVSDMSKSIVFEKCDNSQTEKVKDQEQILERSDLDQNYETVTNMAQSVQFETCEKPQTGETQGERHLERSALSIEENYKSVSDMAQSIVFAKCELPVHDNVKCEEALVADKANDDKESKHLISGKKDIPIKEHKTDEFFEDRGIVSHTTDMLASICEGDADGGKVSPYYETEKSAKSPIKSSPERLNYDTPSPLDGTIDSAKTQSGKSTPEVPNTDHMKIVSHDPILSGKSTPELQTADHMKVDSHDPLLSGKSSPGLSGKSSPGLPDRFSPEAKAESKDSLLSGKSTPEPSKGYDKSSKLSPALVEKDNINQCTEQEAIGIKGPLSAQSSPIISGKSSPINVKEHEATDKKIDDAAYEKDKKKIDEENASKEFDKKHATKEPSTPEIFSSINGGSHQDYVKTTLTVQESEKKLSVSDVHIHLKEDEWIEKVSSDLSKSESPEETKQLDVDSIDSGIGTEATDSKAKKREDIEKDVAVKVQEDASFKEDISEKVETIKESMAGPSTTLSDGTLISPVKTSTEDLHLSGKSTPDIAEIEKLKEMQETLKHEKHIPGSSTPPTVPASPNVKEISTPKDEDAKTSALLKSFIVKDNETVRSCTPGSDDYEIGASTHSDISSGQVSRAPQLLECEINESDEDDDVPGSPMSVTSQVAHSRSSSRYDFEDDRILTKMDPMNTSFYGALPDEHGSELNFEKALVEHRQTRGEDLVSSSEDSSNYLYEVTTAKYSTGSSDDGQMQLDQINKNGEGNLMKSSFLTDVLPTTTATTATTSSDAKKDPLDAWGKPLGLPSPAPPNDNRGTPKKERKLPSNVSAKNKLNDDKKRSDSPSKYRSKRFNPVYVDLTYVPHHGNTYYSYVDFFKRVRARYYVFSGIEPSREVYNALLEAKQTWDDKELEVTIIPTYDTDILGYWVAENEELLTKYKIDLSPSASRCTINLQDHETSCSAYRLEF